MIKRAYWQGFAEECYRNGVDPDILIKVAISANQGLNYSGDPSDPFGTPELDLQSQQQQQFNNRFSQATTPRARPPLPLYRKHRDATIPLDLNDPEYDRFSLRQRDRFVREPQ